MPQDPFGEPHFLNQTLLQVPGPWKQKTKAIPPLTLVGWVSGRSEMDHLNQRSPCIFSGFFLRPKLLCFVGRIHPRFRAHGWTEKTSNLQTSNCPRLREGGGFCFFGYPKSRWSSKVGDDTVTGCLEWFPKKNTNIFSHTKMSFIAIAVYIFDSWCLDCSFNQYSIILRHMIMWLRLDVLVGFIDTWAFDWIVSTPHPATVTTRIIPLFRFPKSELDLHLWRLHPGGGGVVGGNFWVYVARALFSYKRVKCLNINFH